MEQYALIALHKMCRNEVRGYQTCTAEPPGGSVVSISDLYHSDTVVAVFTMNAFFPDHLLEKRDAVELNEYFLEHITSFYEIGLYPYPYPAPNWESDEVRVISARRHVPTLSDSADKRNLHLEPLSNNLAVDDKTFLLTVFQSIDPYERSPFFRFFLYYQVFELWIQSTYRTEIASFREALASAEKEDASILRERVHKLTESLRERRRLAKVFANNPDEAMARFLECCNGVLDACGVRTEDDAAVALYSVRNRLVHNFSKATCAQPQFEKLADAMLELVCRIARQYSP